MSDPAPAPADIVAELEGRARRVETPCGEGTMVWRIWGEGAPLVVSHGSQGSWSHWIRNIDGLVTSGWQVIAADLPGMGSSAMPPQETHDSISAVLAEGLRQILGEGARADLAGFSFGGAVFANFAARHPQLVRRIIIIGSGGLDTPHGHIDLRSVKGLTGEERQAGLRANLLGLMLRHPESADDLAAHLLVTNARASRLNPVPLVLPDRIVAVLPDLRVPFGAIWGEHDRPHPDPAVQEAAIRRHRPDCDFRVIPEAGHWAMYERPQAFNAALIAMLDQPERN